MKGVIGKFFLQFGVTLCVAVLLSYVEAITLAPARSAQMLKARAGAAVEARPLRRRGFDKLAAAYSKVLALGLKAPVTVLLDCGRTLRPVDLRVPQAAQRVRARRRTRAA